MKNQLNKRTEIHGFPLLVMGRFKLCISHLYLQMSSPHFFQTVDLVRWSRRNNRISKRNTVAKWGTSCIKLYSFPRTWFWLNWRVIFLKSRIKNCRLNYSAKLGWFLINHLHNFFSVWQFLVYFCTRAAWLKKILGDVDLHYFLLDLHLQCKTRGGNFGYQTWSDCSAG